jgi:hypothetical protein
MHNKSFTADNQVSVVGGRNIGNEYFGAGAGVGFADLDVIALGAAVREVSKEFDLYWNSPSAYPAERVIGAPGPETNGNLAARFSAMRADPESVAYLGAVSGTPLIRNLLERRLELEWTTGQLLYDDPAKTLDTTARTDVLLFPELVRTLGRPDKSLELVSPYFVPGARARALQALVQRGVKVRVLRIPGGVGRKNRCTPVREAPPRPSSPAFNFTSLPTAAKAPHESRWGTGKLSGGLAREDFRRGCQLDSSSARSTSTRVTSAEHRDGVWSSRVRARARWPHFSQRGAERCVRGVRLTPDGSDMEWIEQTASGVSA